MGLQAAIEANRRRWARYRRAESILRSVRLKTFEYEDSGKADKAARVIARCKRALGPYWATLEQARARQSAGR